jgi:hypothetical protein
LRLLRKIALSRPQLEVLGKRTMTLALWVLGATLLVLGLTVVGGSVEGNRGPLPDWDKSRAWFQEEGQRDEPPGIAEPAPPWQAEEEETALALQQDGTALPFQENEMAPPLQEGGIAPPLQEEDETVLALQQEEAALALQQEEAALALQQEEAALALQQEEAALALQQQEEAALALQQQEAASSLQAEEVAPPSTTDSLDSGGEGVGGSSPAEPPTAPVLVEPRTSNTQPATSVSQADEHEGGNVRGQEDEAEGGNGQGCEQQRGKTSNESASNQSVRVDDQASRQGNQVRAQAVSASVVTGVAAATDGSSTANQRACVQQGIEDHGDQTLVIRILRGVLRIP